MFRKNLAFGTIARIFDKFQLSMNILPNIIDKTSLERTLKIPQISAKINTGDSSGNVRALFPLVCSPLTAVPGKQRHFEGAQIGRFD
jgi:hypothetical protein